MPRVAVTGLLRRRLLRRRRGFAATGFARRFVRRRRRGFAAGDGFARRFRRRRRGFSEAATAGFARRFFRPLLFFRLRTGFSAAAAVRFFLRPPPRVPARAAAANFFRAAIWAGLGRAIFSGSPRRTFARRTSPETGFARYSAIRAAIRRLVFVLCTHSTSRGSQEPRAL